MQQNFNPPKVKVTSFSQPCIFNLDFKDDTKSDFSRRKDNASF